MRKLLTIGFLALGALGVQAQSTYDRQILSASVGAYPTSTVTATSATIRGAIEEIAFSVPSAGATATVSVVSQPEVGPALVLYTNAAMAASTRVPVRMDGDGTITNTGANYVVLVGDTVTLTVTPVSATSNVNWNAEIKFAR